MPSRVILFSILGRGSGLCRGNLVTVLTGQAPFLSSVHHAPVDFSLLWSRVLDWPKLVSRTWILR